MPSAPIPADGDDYTYKPPLIPAQWVPVTEYHELVKTVERLSERVAELERRLNEAESDM